MHLAERFACTGHPRNGPRTKDDDEDWGTRKHQNLQTPSVSSVSSVRCLSPNPVKGLHPQIDTTTTRTIRAWPYHLTFLEWTGCVILSYPLETKLGIEPQASMTSSTISQCSPPGSYLQTDQ